MGFSAADSLDSSAPASSHAKENNGSGVLDLLPSEAMVGMEVKVHYAEEKKALADEYSALNSSSSPSTPPPVLDFQAVDVQEHNASEEEKDLEISRNETTIASMDLSIKTRHEKEHSSLERLEAALQIARAAIKDAKFGNQSRDPEYVPMGPMYWNSKVFHRRTVRDYVSLIAGKYPFWNRSVGADHFMLACHDWGPETSFAIPYLEKNSIRALCNANTSERFNPMKDVSFPEINLQTGTTRGLIGGPSPSRRSILAFFAGGVHGPIRPILLEHWEDKDDDIRVHKYLPKGVSYYEMMKKASSAFAQVVMKLQARELSRHFTQDVCQC
ncbi:hypothetical protein GH714_038707 [Hevea brasiliensis]|uniref:Exostosin GT47 domain-containing protein n=1 Tax=Hevea brasiliensis TaxID=3981 RepID=A0A6A6KNF2_HEVBR|nr:hypothetical protein GH714_038707 [Hevea brasiliensis]